MPSSCLITGATGFVGGFFSQACAARGLAVRTLARPGSDTSLLDPLGVTVVRGDLTDPASVREALGDAALVFHCAAKVGDWGPVEDYRAVNVVGLRGLLEAVKGRPLQRFVHFSSLGVYPARHHYGTDESEPLPEAHMDGYTQTKVEAEKLALAYHRDHGVPVTVLRPGFIYGPRDRTVLPRLIRTLRDRKFRWLGGGRGALNTIFVGNLVDAALLAADHPRAVGQVYNLTDGQRVTKRQFVEMLVHGLGLPEPPRLGLPLWLARPLARYMEKNALRKGKDHAPQLTQARLKFMGLNLEFSIDKARRELGYQPRTSFEEGMRATIDWYKQHPV